MTAPSAARRLAAALAAAAAFAPAAVRGQQKAAPPRVVAPAVAIQNAWSDEQFESWVFSQAGGSGSPGDARKRFESLLTLQVEQIDRTCRLSDPQKDKLRLMGRGDVKRVFDAYEAAKREFGRLGNDIQKLQEVMPLVTPIQAAAQAGPFGVDSLFAKSLRHVLTAGQYEAYRGMDRERRAARHRAQVDMAVQMVEEFAPLRDAQRRALAELLIRETRPQRTAGSYAFYAVMYQLGQIPNEKLRPAFDDAQWRAVGRLLDQYRQVGPALRAQGILLDEEDADDDPPPAGK